MPSSATGSFHLRSRCSSLRYLISMKDMLSSSHCLVLSVKLKHSILQVRTYIATSFAFTPYTPVEMSLAPLQEPSLYTTVGSDRLE